jgi:pimeloyl-ACP methyl ester carboxylesterase
MDGAGRDLGRNIPKSLRPSAALLGDMVVLAFMRSVVFGLALGWAPLAQADTPAVTTQFIRIAPGVPGVLYAPARPGPKAATGVLIMHSAADYLAFPGCTELARRGYRALCVNNSTSKSGAFNDGVIDQVMLEMKAAMLALRAQPGIARVVLLGHSGGGTVMSAYQMIAEGGVKACQGPEKIWKCPNGLADMPPADGVMLVDSNWGLAAMTLFSLDPAVSNEDDATALNPALDMFNPANGFNASGSSYSPAFVKSFLGAVATRAQSAHTRAQASLAAIRAGKGPFEDNGPFVLAGASLLGGNNKLFSQDTSLMAHTQGSYPLIHADGSITNEVIKSVRLPENTRNLSPSYQRGALRTSVTSYLSTYAIRVSDDLNYDASGVTGVDWTSTYASPPGNVQGISAPLLVMGMTAHWEFLAAETLYRLARSKDKSIAFVEGADHLYVTCRPCEKKPGEFGDTQKTTYDFIDRWLSAKGRFNK